MVELNDLLTFSFKQTITYLAAVVIVKVYRGHPEAVMYGGQQVTYKRESCTLNHPLRNDLLYILNCTGTFLPALALQKIERYEE